MLRKVIAWSTLVLALEFVILSLAILFGDRMIGAAALPYVKWTAVGSLALALVLALALLPIGLEE